MKKIFKHLFVLMVMFMLPMFVLAEETTTFDHIDIDPTVSLKYTVLGNVETHSKTLDSSLAGLKIYELAQDGTTKVEPAISISNAEYINDSSVYRVNGEFKKYYDGSDKEVKYLVEYEFEVTVPGTTTTKSATYSKEYSYSSEDDGILVNLTSEDSIKTFAPSIVINKKVKLNTPDGTFAFKITKGDGTSQTVNVTTKGASDQNEGVGSETIYLDLNTTYTIEEINIPSTYELDSISSSRGTVDENKIVTFTTGNSVDDVVEVTAVNKSKVDHSKILTDNGDGTYQISLDVTGKVVEDVSKVSNANILIIYDVSNSMISNYVPTATGRYGLYVGGSSSHGGGASDGTYYTLYDSSGNALTNDTYTGKVYTDGYLTNEYTGQRYALIRRADAAEKTLYDFINKLTGDGTLYFSLVTFSGSGNVYQTWTTDATKITDNLSTTGNYNSAKLSYSTGTNWEDALATAATLTTSSSLPNTNPVYIIFITDGAPSRSNTHPQNGGNGRDGGNQGQQNNNAQDYYEDARDEARSLYNTAVSTKGTFFSIYAYGKETDWLASLTYYAYNGSEVSSDKLGTTFDTEGYYNASSTEDLEAAVQSIYQTISQNLGINDVTINDGTTNKVTVTTSTGTKDYKLLSVDTSSYAYWLTFPVTVKDGKYYIYVNNTEVEVNESATTLTWGTDNTLNITDSEIYTEGTNVYFRYSWKGTNYFYNVAPPVAYLDTTTGSVIWDLSSIDLLLNDIKYTVTFNVWPSQTTYDLIADLNNGIIKYEGLDEEIQKYILKNSNGTYTLLTNTTATLTYRDSREDDNPETTTSYVNPDPVITEVSEITIKKNWVNDLDGRKVSSIAIFLTKDTANYTTSPYELTSANDWEKKVYIATGLISSYDTTTGIAEIRENGHDYSFVEVDSGYYWDFSTNVVRPMIIYIDGEPVIKMLYKTNENITFESGKNCVLKDGLVYFKIDGNVYYLSDDTEAIISATNTRRANLNLTKLVEDGAPSDAEFTFSITVTSADGEDVWFSIYEAESSTTPITDTTLVVSGATKGYDEESGEFTGYYYASSGSEIVVKLKKNYNLRFINLPINSTYTIVEDNLSNFRLNSSSVMYGNNNTQYTNATANINIASKTVSGTIYENNRLYKVTYTNEYLLTLITVTKSYSTNSPITPAVYVQLSNNANSDTDTQVLRESNNWTYTWYKEKYTASGALITYYVTETSLDTTGLPTNMTIVYDEVNNVYMYKNTRTNDIIGKWTPVTSGNMSTGFTITNTYKAMPTKTLYFVKMTFKGTTLSGATFELYKYIGESSESSGKTVSDISSNSEWILISTATSDEEGNFSFSNLYQGEYRLVETIAPANCVLPTGQWIIFLDYKDANEDELVVRDNVITSTDPSNTPAISPDGDGKFVVYNKEIPNIPTTGGIGMPHYNKYGLLMMMLSVVICLFGMINQRKQIENI